MSLKIDRSAEGVEPRVNVIHFRIQRVWRNGRVVAFRFVRYGQAAVDLLNQRLDGADTKELIGKPGLKTDYKVKQLVQAIKKSAEEFEAGDEQFLSLVRRAMKGEEETVGKRFAGKLG